MRQVHQLMIEVVEAACAARDIDWGSDDDPGPALDRLEKAVDRYRAAVAQPEAAKDRRTMQLDEPPEKRCSKCREDKGIAHFPITSARGRIYRRSWCSTCLKTYYATRHKRQKIAAHTEATDGEVHPGAEAR